MNLDVEYSGSEFMVHITKHYERKTFYLSKEVAVLYCIHPPQFIKFGVPDIIFDLFYSRKLPIPLTHLRVLEFDSLPLEGVQLLNQLLKDPSMISIFAKQCFEKEWHYRVLG